jgi:hypothetical protein
VATSVPAGYQVTVTESSSTMVYGGTSPDFTITVAVPPSDAGQANYQRYVYLQVDSNPLLILAGGLTAPGGRSSC